ncbi:NAD(P)-binding protein [Coniophora puteana RWD-64-598 SS2]|uniref:NAD(P)-binding protein n=1 Tax=Coniophora puteana (strain RWD-64-598) TaxID=741705 RepID=A0A5M3MD90_CONPW|nr:NAD(P)-binding protein [Coniophora puteana RWD-64-598 SS2]EIW76595.1 NAD(P)-binding protein [Coniophora puteana RWD-64-598 SS2]
MASYSSLPKTIKEYRSNSDGYRKLRLCEAPLEHPEAAEVLVRVHSVSMNYRDLVAVEGTYAGLKPKPNVVPCCDAAGSIALLGADVASSGQWSVGERVCVQVALDYRDGEVGPETMARALGGAIDGVLREYVRVPAHALVKIPENLTYDEASTLPCAALTAYNALFELKPLKKGDYVLLLGTGGVSIFGLQFAVAAGATAIVTSSSDEKLKLAKKLGAQHTINYNKIENWDDEVLNITGGQGVDHVIEVGGSGTIAKSVNAARYSGCVDLIGFVAQGENQVPVGLTIHKALVVRGILIGSAAQFEAMNRFISEHDIHPIVDKVFSFEEAVDAFAYLGSQKHVGKVVIRLI